MSRVLMMCLGLLGVCLALAGGVRAEEKDAAEHMRFVEDEDGAARLETVVVKMTGPSGVQVDMVGAVHVADAAYFEGLNERFKGYDAVLYELVGSPEKGKPLGNRAVANDARLGWIGTLQQKMKEALKLEGQLEKIDYTAANFVHADMGMEEFQKTQETKQETFLGLWLKAMAAQQSVGSSEAAGNDLASVMVLMQILMKKDGSDDLKRLIGREFDQVESIMSGLEAGGGTVIIGERNRVALEVMAAQIAVGKKRLAIFYGAGHFPDMQKRLEAMGFKKSGEEWLAAWSVPAQVVEKKKAKKKVDGEVGK
jgi:hypothetical protein